MSEIQQNYDVLIAGTGVAGLMCALNLPRDARILMLTKAAVDESDSFLAQGGICMLRGEEDYKSYFEDTMRAGHYENNEAAVRQMILASPDMIRELVADGVDFARDEQGNFRFTREGGHSRPRILFHDDVTGKEITGKLLRLVRTLSNVKIVEYADGMVGNFITTTGEAPGTNRLEIACERGRVILEKNKIMFNRNEVETSVYSRTASADFGSPPYWECDIPFEPETRPPHRIVIENVAEAIRNGVGLIAPMAEGIRSLELGNAMLLSGLKDKTVTLPMDAAEYAELLDSLVKNSKPRIPRQARKSSSAGFEKSF